MKSILLFAGLLLGALTAFSQTVDVTFKVDMSLYGGVIDASGMHVAGSFPTGTWTPAARPMTDEGDGIWSYTESLEAGSTLEYKFVRGNDWPFGDENMSGKSCAAPFSSNRLLTVPAENTVLTAFCYESCNACPAVILTSDVTFVVDMSLQTIDFDNGGVSISGTFNSFAKTPMVDQGAGIYSVTLSLVQGNVEEYKFRNGDAFENPFGACASGSFGNRVVTVSTNDETLPTVCYASCEACVTPGDNYDVTFQVNASQIDVDAAGVHIAGNFNGFSPTPMINNGDGTYSYTTSISEGSIMLWKYLNGNSFDGVESVPGDCGNDDGFGGFNRIDVGPSEDTILDLVCFGSCADCTAPGTNYDVTFQVDASQITVAAEGLHIAGTFNGFNPTPMTSNGDGTYSFTASIEEGSTILWKYLNGNSFDGAESVPGDCGNDDGFGGFNRVATGPSANTTLDLVCFASCVACDTDICNANGGTLSAPTNRSFCVGTGSPVGIAVTVTGAVGTNQAFALTDNANGNIVATRFTNSNFNLDIYPPGSYSIRYIRFENDVVLGGITNISQAETLEGCYGLASNSIGVTLSSEPTAGTLTALSPTTVCANSGPSTGIQVGLSGLDAQNVRYGLTSNALGNQVIASNAGTANGTTFNLNGLAPGTYTVAAIGYQNGVNIAGVQFANQLQGCYDLSNFVSVTISDCAALKLASQPNPTADQSFVTFTNPREEYATLEVYDMSGRMVERLFNQVTQAEQEYRLEFNGAGLPNGVYLYRLTTDSEVITHKFMIAH